MHPNLWTADSTNTIKRDSFKSRSSSSGLNSIYATFNIQEPTRTSKDTSERKKDAVFTLESLFGSQNTSGDGLSVGTDFSGGGSDWYSRRCDAFSVGRHSDRCRRKSDSTYRCNSVGPSMMRRQHNRYNIESNSQTIHNFNAMSSKSHNSRSCGRQAPDSGSSTPSMGASGVSVSLPKHLGDYESESIPEESGDDLDDFPYDLSSTVSAPADSRKRSTDAMSITTTYSGTLNSYVSAQYSKKWRVGIAVLVGGILIALCLLGFYLNAESRKAGYQEADKVKLEKITSEGATAVGTGGLEGLNAKASVPIFTAPASTSPDAKLTSLWRTTNKECEQLEVNCPPGYSSPLVILIALGGVANSMLTEKSTPALHHLASCGVQAEHLTPVYPTTTAPNMYSIVTGLYPESHGIVGHEIYDQELNKTFKFGKYESFESYWWGGDPIWNTIRKKDLKSAMYFWPGSDVQVGGHYPLYWYKYRKEYPLDTRVNKIIDWLQYEEEERPSLLGLYFDTPDIAAREAGPLSKRMNETLRELDHQIDRLMTVLHVSNLTSCVEVLVVSDHGQAPSSCGSSLFLESFMKDITTKARVVSGAVGRLKAVPGMATDAEILSTLRCKNRRLRALSKPLLPNRYHYGNHRNIEPVILDTLPGNRVVTADTDDCDKAESGYNNIDGQMQGVFLARGPSFKVGYRGPGFRNVELYNLLARLLRVEPSPNNGTRGSLYHFLSDPPLPPPIKVDAWHENVLPFLHARVRDEEFINELKLINLSESTTSAPLSSTTPLPQTTPPTKASETPVAATDPAPQPTASEAITAATHVTAATAATTVTTAAPVVEGQGITAQATAALTTTPSTSAQVSNPIETVQREGKMTVLESNAPALVEHNNSSEAVSPAHLTTSDHVQEPHTVVQVSKILEVPQVIVKLEGINTSDVKPFMHHKETQTSSDDFMDILNSEDINATPVVGDVVEVATSAAIALSSETTLPASKPSDSSMITTTTTAASTTSSTVPTTSSTATMIKEEQTNSSGSTVDSAANAITLSLLTSTTTALPPPSTTTSTNNDTKERYTDSSHPVEEGETYSRKKREACDCPATSFFQTEALRGEPAGKMHISFHCPFGTPLYSARMAPKGTHYILPHSSHVTGYIGEMGTALWSSYTLTNKSLELVDAERPVVSDDKVHPEEVSEVVPPRTCWKADPRLPRDTNQQCLEYLEDERYNTDTVSITQLFPEVFESQKNQMAEGYLLSNAIALNKGFVKGGLQSILRLMREWTSLRNVINVISGPVWDRNFNGRGDTIVHIRSRVEYLIPSHVFFLVSSCKPTSGFDAQEHDLSKCPIDDLDTLVFVFPNSDVDDNCLMGANDYCRYHLTTMADLQRLTGLHFFSSIKAEPALRTLLAYQPLQLWRE